MRTAAASLLVVSICLASAYTFHLHDHLFWRWSEYRHEYQRYLETFPAGAHSDEARRLHDDHDWQRASVNKSEAEFEQYVNKHPSGSYAANAIKQLEGLRWTNAFLAHTAEAYGRYIGQHPTGRHRYCAERMSTVAKQWERFRDAQTARLVIDDDDCAKGLGPGIRQQCESMLRSAGLRIADTDAADVVLTVRLRSERFEYWGPSGSEVLGGGWRRQWIVLSALGIRTKGYAELRIGSERWDTRLTREYLPKPDRRGELRSVGCGVSYQRGLLVDSTGSYNALRPFRTGEFLETLLRVLTNVYGPSTLLNLIRDSQALSLNESIGHTAATLLASFGQVGRDLASSKLDIPFFAFFQRVSSLEPGQSRPLREAFCTCGD